MASIAKIIKNDLDLRGTRLILVGVYKWQMQ